MKIIDRPIYLQKLKRLRNTPDIKIITGMRRAGKSMLLKLYTQYLQADNENVNIITIDFNDLNFNTLKNHEALFAYVESKYSCNKENILIIDEVQLCSKFELAINSFHNSGKYDIYITGSNAFLLSSDLATLFTGRYIEISVYPFSFAEYCSYFNITNDYNKHLENYLQQGGLAGSYLYKEHADATNYLNNIYLTLIKRDLVDKYKINDLSILDNLTEFLLDNISNLTTNNKISSMLQANNISTNHITIGNYINYLCNAFMFYKLKRYDLRGKKYLSRSEKYYVTDLSLRYAILGNRNMDFGRAYENLVAIELLRRGYDVYVGKLYEKEIDFVAMKSDAKIYFQVSDNISDQATLARELAPLKAIKDSYPKYLLANTYHDDYDIEGIKIINLPNWLLNTK